MYETQTNSNHTDHGAPDQLGSGSGAPLRKRRSQLPPEYLRSLLADPDVRDLVAGACSDTVADLNSELQQNTSTAAAAVRWQIRTLTAVMAELRPEPSTEVQ